jgi:hypothetical protein
MRGNGTRIVLHLSGILAIALLLSLGMAYPFLPGTHDILALPVSTGIQITMTLSLPLALLGLLWLVWEIGARRSGSRTYAFGLAALITGSALGALVCLTVFLAFNKLPGIVACGILCGIIWRLFPKVKALRHAERFPVAPLYLLLFPAILLLVQWVIAEPLTSWSRDLAIANSEDYRDAIEHYWVRYGSYPPSLLGQSPDFHTGVVGIEKYHYTSYGDSYNLFFEHPRFLLHQVGTREWVIYNPRDQQFFVSHTAWLLEHTPEELMHFQGWYVAHNARQPHWKYFWFD